MFASAILSRVWDDLHDEEGIRFTTENLLAWLSDAQRAIVLLRPDAGAVTKVVTLLAGATQQMLPANGVRFLGVLRNIKADGKSGRAVMLTTLEALNAGAPLWHVGGLSPEVFEYAPDENTPTIFWVSPPPAENVQVEIKYAVEPPEITRVGDELAVFGTFAEPLREYMLYRAYARNDAQFDYQARANFHLQRFYTAIGDEQKARILSSPLNELGGGK